MPISVFTLHSGEMGLGRALGRRLCPTGVGDGIPKLPWADVNLNISEVPPRKWSTAIKVVWGLSQKHLDKWEMDFGMENTVGSSSLESYFI